MTKIKDAIQTIAQAELVGVFNEKAAKQFAARIAEKAEEPVLQAIVEQLQPKKRQPKTQSAAEKKKAAEKKRKAAEAKKKAAAEKKAKEAEAKAKEAEPEEPAADTPPPAAAANGDGGSALDLI